MVFPVKGVCTLSSKSSNAFVVICYQHSPDCPLIPQNPISSVLIIRQNYIGKAFIGIMFHPKIFIVS